MTGISWHGKVWCVVDGRGKPLRDTLADTRWKSIETYEYEASRRNIPPYTWVKSKAKFGVRCVRFVVDMQEISRELSSNH